MAEIQAILLALAFTNIIKYKMTKVQQLCGLSHFMLIIVFNTIVFLMTVVTRKVSRIRSVMCKEPLTKRYPKLMRTMRTNIASMMIIIYGTIPN